MLNTFKICEANFVLKMPFTKSFPRKSQKSPYPFWEEITLTREEEKYEENKARIENIKLMKECIDDAKSIIKEKSLKDYQTDLVNIALGLFEKRASHVVYWKENKAKEKFNETNKV